MRPSARYFLLLFLCMGPLVINGLHSQSKTTEAFPYCCRAEQFIHPWSIPHSQSLEDSISVRIRRNTAFTKETLSLFYAYRDTFAKEVSRAGLPDFFQYIPLIYGNMNFRYQEKGRKGIWFLPYLTAVHSRLRTDAHRDECFDPLMSGAVAVSELKRLFILFEGDPWETLLAYFHSAADMRSAKIRLGLDAPSPWDLQSEMGMERDVIASLLSWMYVCRDGSLTPDRLPATSLETEECVCKHPLSVSLFKQWLDMDEKTFVCCNPSLLDAYTEKGDILRYPSEKAVLFMQLEDSLYAQYAWQRRQDSVLQAQADSVARVQDSLQQVKAASEKTIRKTTYTVRSGDVLGKIAARYGVRVADIKRWNGLKSDTIRIGQKLIIHLQS